MNQNRIRAIARLENAARPYIGMRNRIQHLTRERQADPIKFIEEVLINPETGKPFELLDAERCFLEHAFRVGEDGRLLYSEQIYSCPKKSGKTTFAAIYVITLVLLFGGAYPEAIIAANDFEQSIGRVFAAIKRIIERSPLLHKEARITADRITIGGAVITAIPSNYASAAGSNQNVAVFDELWAYDRDLLRSSVLLRRDTHDEVPHQRPREESVMKCSNPACNRGIGLVSHRHGWFGKPRYCSRNCRDAFVADLPKRPRQEPRAMTYFEWLFSQPIDKPRQQLMPALIRTRAR